MHQNYTIVHVSGIEQCMIDIFDIPYIVMCCFHFQHNFTVSEKANQPEQKGNGHTVSAGLQQHDCGRTGICYWEGNRYESF